MGTETVVSTLTHPTQACTTQSFTNVFGPKFVLSELYQIPRKVKDSNTAVYTTSTPTRLLLNHHDIGRHRMSWTEEYRSAFLPEPHPANLLVALSLDLGVSGI